MCAEPYECRGVDAGAEAEVEGGDEAEELGLIEVIPEQRMRVEVSVLVRWRSLLHGGRQRVLPGEGEHGRMLVLVLLGSSGGGRHSFREAGRRKRKGWTLVLGSPPSDAQLIAYSLRWCAVVWWWQEVGGSDMREEARAVRC